MYESKNKAESLIREVDSSQIISFSNNIANITILIFTFYLGTIIGSINGLYSSSIQGIISISKDYNTVRKLLDVIKNYTANDLINTLTDFARYLYIFIVIFLGIIYMISSYNKLKKLTLIELYEYQFKYCKFRMTNNIHRWKKK